MRSASGLEIVGFDESLEHGLLLCKEVVKLCACDVALGLVSDRGIKPAADLRVTKSAVKADSQPSIDSNINPLNASRKLRGALVLSDRALSLKRVRNLQMPDPPLEIDDHRDDDRSVADGLAKPLCDLAVHVIVDSFS